jgi:RsiW-degrading membrane proteinase PrsW (M82 family)
MQSGRDPVQQAADAERDLYEVSTWEPRSRLDRFVAGADSTVRTVYRLLLLAVAGASGLSVFALSALVLWGQVRSGGLGAVSDPTVAGIVVLSVVPALVLAAYVWRADVTSGEPLALLVVTFLLIVLLAGFAAILNELGSYALGVQRGAVSLSMLAFYYVVVGPVEESVKLLAVRLHAYRSDRFDAVIDGAVYGAVAGLGFATIENAIYITGALESTSTVLGTLEQAGGMTAARALAGPGHVIYSALAGFYLGLAKFNREYAVPLVLKGLILAALIHGTYNVGATVVPPLVYASTPLSQFGAVIAFVGVFDTAAGYFLYRKIKRYRDTFHDVDAGRWDDRVPLPEMTEFDPPTRRATTADGAVGTQRGGGPKRETRRDGPGRTAPSGGRQETGTGDYRETDAARRIDPTPAHRDAGRDGSQNDGRSGEESGGTRRDRSPSGERSGERDAAPTDERGETGSDATERGGGSGDDGDGEDSEKGEDGETGTSERQDTLEDWEF